MGLLLSGDFLKLSVLPVPLLVQGANEPIDLMNHIFLKFIQYINKYNIKDKDFEEVLCMILEEVVENRLFMLYSFSDTIELLSSDYYDFSTLISDIGFSRMLFDYADSSNIQSLLALIIPTADGKYDYLTLPDYIQVSVNGAIQDIAEKGALDYIESILDEAIDDHNEYCEDEYFEDCCQMIIDDLADGYSDEIRTSAEKAKEEFIMTVKLIHIEKYIEFNLIPDYTEEIIMHKLKP